VAVQLTLHLQPGLTQHHKTLREVTHKVALNFRGGPAAIAPALDMSPSELARKLAGNPDDSHRTLDIDDFVKVLEATGDFTPIYWLIEKFLPSDDQKVQAAADVVLSLAPQLAAAMAVLGAKPAKGGRR
jgi:hypothetical protein